MNRMSRVAALCLMVGLVVRSVVVAQAKNSTPSPEHAKAYVIEHMHSRTEATGRIVWYRTLAELLPNVTYAEPGGVPVHLADAVVVGAVTDVSPGFGFVPGDVIGDGVPVAFDNPIARWKTVHLTVRRDAVLGAGLPSDDIRVGLAVNGGADFAHVAAGLRALGRVALFLRTGSPVFGYDPSLYSIVDDGALLATVDTAGRLGLPFLDDDLAAGMVAATPTLTDLEQRLLQPARTIQLERRGGVLYRAG